MTFQASKRARKARWRRALLALVGLLVSACTFDPDDRCGPLQKLTDNEDVCVCEDGAALTAAGCVLCGEHEEPGADGCVCETGYLRPSEGAACEAAPASLGAACSEEEPCTDATFSHCEPASNGSGYCTNVGCTSSTDCFGGYACNSGVCRRPPLGLGKSCDSPSDCADGEATFCESFQTHQCLVQGCSLSPDNCFEGWTCNDLSALGMPTPVCLPTGSL